MPKPMPAAQASIAGAMWLNSRLPLAATASGRPFSRKCQPAAPGWMRTQLAFSSSRGCRGHAVLPQIGRARDHHAADAAELLRDQRRILQRADADADVDAFLQQVHLAVVQQHAAAHLVVALEEANDRRRHVHVAEQHRRRDRELPRGLGRVDA